MKTLLSIGHGYSARALGRLLLSQGWRIIATSRSAEKVEMLRSEGLEAMVWTGGPLPLSEATHLLSSVGPDSTGDPVLAAQKDAIAAAQHLTWVGYLSTVGVYGDHAGGWVDEDTPLTPGTARGKARVAAEAEWQALGLPLHIFRLAGIYGPGRGPFAKVRNGTARLIIKPGQVFSRIHVDDIAQVLAVSIAQPNPGRVYNVCDDLAAPPEDVLAYAAELLGLPRPPEEPFDPSTMTPMAASFYAENKRVRNDRLKEELGVQLRYPDYRAGLQAILRSED